MNETVGILSMPSRCDICQTSYGFTSADRRSIIVLVVLTGIALILCYVGVLWYAIRKRFIPDDKLPIVAENVHTNQAFDDNEVQNGDIDGHVKNTDDIATTQPAVFMVEKEKERY